MNSTILTNEMLATAEGLFLDMCAIGISPRNAVLLASEKMGFDKRMTNTLYARFVGRTIEENMLNGMSIEKAVRKALSTFDNDSKDAAEALIKLEEIEMRRIHYDVNKSELVGIGVPGGKRGPDGRQVGAIKIFGEDDNGEEVQIDAESLRKN